jgi:hypothetical protein
MSATLPRSSRIALPLAVALLLAGLAALVPRTAYAVTINNCANLAAVKTTFGSRWHHRHQLRRHHAGLR